MAKTTAEVRSADTFVRVGSSAPAAQQAPAPAVFRASSLTTTGISGADRRDAHLVLAQVRAGGPVAAQMRPMPSPTAGAYRGGYSGGYSGGYAGGYVATVPSYSYAPSYGYATPGYATGYYGGAAAGGGILGWLFGGGAQISATVGPNGLTVGATTGAQMYVQQAQLAPADCIVQDGYGRQFAVRYGQQIPAGYQVVMYNPDWWTWLRIPNMY